ncbi:galectin-3b [Heptranchias perlo]|uniref:galectin-3b n=1 Tax=Heptranchias perlo TaxID=212740 RepID=UPI00355A9D02
MDELSLEDALGPDPSSAAKLNSGSTNPQPAWPAPQPGWPAPQPGWPAPQSEWPAPQSGWPAPQPGPYGPPGQAGPYGPPGQAGPYGPPGQAGPYGPPGQAGPYGPPGQAGPVPPMPAPFGSPGVPNQPVPPGGAVLPVPYEIALPGGWIPQKMIRIMGTVKMNVDGFVVDVYCDKDIAFHFSARFKEGGCHQVIVRNNRIHDAWGREERAAPRFPFKPGERFEMLILGDPTQYRVAVNNQHLLEFKHRSNTLNQVTRVSIRGDINLHAMFMV